MKKIILLVMFCFSTISFYAVNTIADTNKVDATGAKTGFWKEKTPQTDWYGNYEKGLKMGT